MRSIIRLFDIFTAREKRFCILLVFCMVLGAIFEAIGISAILPLISILSDEQFLEKYPLLKYYLEMIGVTGHIQFIFLSSMLLIVWYIFKNVYMVWLVKKQVSFSMKNQVRFAKSLMALYLGKPYLYHLEQNTSILLRNVQSSLVVIFMNMFISVFSLFTEIITAIVIWMMLLLIDPFTATVVAGIMTLIVYSIMRAVRKKLGNQGEIQNQCIAEFTKWLNQGLGAIKETKVLRKEKYFLDQFCNSYQDYGNAQTYFSIINQLPRFFVEASVTIGLLVLIITKLGMGVDPKDIVPLLGVLALAAFRLMPCANRIINLSNGIKYYIPTFNNLYQDLMEIKQHHPRDHDFKVSSSDHAFDFKEAISIEHLAFRYPNGAKNVLNQISFHIPKGNFVGIVGSSGAGKTTFVDILLGLLEPTDGTIKVDGQDIFQNISGWQAKLSYVPQSIYLIDGTICDNIAMGIAKEDIDRERVIHALKMAELFDFVQNLPEGLETKVGERGAKLSGGQRQRIGIARALYQQPEVLILDEATSALDNETEKNITDTILKLKGNITIIAIAHRVSTLENCDFKVKFEQGFAEIIK